MKLVINIDGTLVLVNQTSCGPLVESLSGAKLLSTTGYGSSLRYEQKSDVEVTLLMVADDRFDPISDPVKKLQEEKAASDTRWIEYYNKSTALEKQLKELYADLDSRQISYTKTEAKA